MKFKPKKIICMICIFTIMFSVFGGFAGESVFAKINENYGGTSYTYEIDLDQSIENDVILSAIARFIYDIACWIESGIRNIFKLLTGDNMFPWADRIIFNTIPFLDVNFINPAEGSLFLTEQGDTLLMGIILKLYYTILILCFGFLGTITAVMAIKLAITTISEKKAKYKEALVKFLTAALMLFCIHYGLSLIFYINEQIVEIASSMLESEFENVNISLASSLSYEEAVDAFIECNSESDVTSLDIIRNNKYIVAYLISNKSYVEARLPDVSYSDSWYRDQNTEAVKTLASDINTINGNNSSVTIENVKNALEVVNGNQVNLSELNQIAIYKEISDKIEFDYVKDTYCPKFYIEQRVEYDITEISDNVWQFTKYTSASNGQVEKTITLTNDEIKNIFVSSKKTFNDSYKPVLNAYNKIKSSGGVQNLGTTSAYNLISDMGEYFREAAFTYATDSSGKIKSWTPTEVTVQGAILYAIFIAQSILFFLAYIRRFFYVVILAMLAPVIILYDYLTKALA